MRDTMSRLGLRTVFTAATLALGCLALGASACLMMLTASFHRATAELGDALESVRLGEQIERSLVEDPARDATPALRRKLRTIVTPLYQFSSDDVEAGMIRRAQEKLDLYLAAPAEARAQALAELRAALASVVSLNVEQSRELERRVAGWDRLAFFAGLAMAVTLLVGVLVLLLWIHAIAFRPLLSISGTMRRFGRGEVQARAPEVGPGELRSMARDFNALADVLAQHRQAQLSFLAGVGHDLRNCLVPLKAAADLLDLGGVSLPPDRVQKILRSVRHQVDRIDHMVGDLMEASRLEASRLELDTREVDAVEVVKEAVERYRITTRIHRFRVRLPDEPLALRCDPQRLEQVLDNLLRNAIKYSPRGGLIDVALDHGADDAVLSVSDEGIGVPLEERERIFEPFSRGANARATAPGLGLGLAVAKRIVEAHGGRLSVQGRPGGGSTFVVQIPLAPLLPSVVTQDGAQPHP
jgi:signal transduction histidine kinase